jgi:uncharacterized membrane protein YhaH (DUF805 family)
MKITFAGAVKNGIMKAFVFRGTASRREFWYFFLFRVLIGVVAVQLDQLFFAENNVATANASPEAGPLTTAASILLLLPSLSVTVRRFRDAGWSGKWMFMWAIPFASLFLAAFGFASFLNGLEMPEQSVVDEALLQYLAPSFLITAAVLVFMLTLCLRPSKSREQGNKYAPEA